MPLASKTTILCHSSKTVFTIHGRLLRYLLLLFVLKVSCYSPSHNGNKATSSQERTRAFSPLGESRVEAAAVQRRKFLTGSAAAVTLLFDPHGANAVLSSKPCASGVGEGCDELAENNEFIKQLQVKSAENKEMYQLESLNAYYMKNYPDFFAALNPPRYMVKQPDGSFQVYTDKELAELKAKNLIKIELPKTKGGKFQDLTQKPIMVLVQDESDKTLHEQQ